MAPVAGDPSLAFYDHCDVVPGADLGTALREVRALKERQAREWKDKAAPVGGRGGIAHFQVFTGSPDRWGTEGAYGNPEVITWSLASDDADYFPDVDSRLFEWMDLQFNNNTALWVGRIEDGFQRWSDLTGITFVRVRFEGNEWDDGAPYGAGAEPGRRGDIRIFAQTVPGPAVAIAEPPQGIPPNASPGEITFDLETWANTTWNPQYGFERAIHHEIGHAIGLDHTCPAQSNTKLMQPFASTPFGTPQHDDVRGGQALYGDPLEPNDTREQASFFQVFPFGWQHVPATWPVPDSLVFPGGVLSIDNGTDVDWFEFGLLAGANMDITLRQIGGSYADWPVDPNTLDCPMSGGSVNSAMVTRLSVQIWRAIDANDNDGVPIAEATVPVGGTVAQLVNVKLKYPGRYRIRVGPALSISLPKQSQQYELEVSWNPYACANSPSPSTYCSDNDPQNGVESCESFGGCVFEYIDDDYNFNSVPDSMDWWLIDCDGSNRFDVGETAYSTTGQARPRIRGQDECGDAQPITSGIDYEYMTYYASPDPGINAPSKDEAGVWFSYTPRTNGVVRIQVRSHVEFATELYVSPGSCSSSSSTVCASGIEWSPFGQPLGQLAEQVFDGRANVEHKIRVSGHTSNVFLGLGDFKIRIDGPEDVTNDCNRNGSLDVCELTAPDCNANGIIDSCELVGATNHCFLSENASGPGAIISAMGSLSIAGNDLTLVAEGANPGVLGYFVASTSRLPVPEEGKVCLAGPLLRLGALQVGADGTATMQLDFPTYSTQMTPGSTWNFQFWFRDNGGPGIGYPNANVSDAIELTFCP